MRKNREEQAIDKILRVLYRIERKIEYFLGTYSRYIGQAAEVLTQRIIEKTREDGLQVDDIFIPPLEIIDTNLRERDYEIDILAKDPDGNYWIIESTTYPILNPRQIEKFVNRVSRWIRDNKIQPFFILFAYGGIDHGLYLVLSNKLEKITKGFFILDKLTSEKFLAKIRG